MKHLRALLPLCLLAPAAAAQEAHWINPAGGAFGDPANWSPALAPDETKDLFFDLAATFTSTLQGDHTVRSLTVAGGTPTLDLGDHRLTMLAPLTSQTDLFKVRYGELLFPPLSTGRLEVPAGTLVIEPDTSVYQLGRTTTIAPLAALILRGEWLWCSPNGGCVNFFVNNQGTCRVEGGTLAAGGYSSSGTTEIIGGIISHDGGSSSGHLIVRDGGRLGGWSVTTLGGTFHLSSGGEVYGTGSSAWVDIRGTGHLEGAGTRINAHYILNGGHVTVRDGAALGVSSGSVNSGTIIIQSGGTVHGNIAPQGPARVRLEPGAVGPTSLWFGRADLAVEFLIDAARPDLTIPIAGASHASGRGLAGSLRIELLNTNPLAPGDVIPLISHPQGFTGSFHSVTLPTLDGGRALEVAIEPTRVVLRVVQGAPSCYSADFDGDGDTGTDADIEAFFACLAGTCCPNCPASADFNGDGDTATDADIEAFFRVLAGGSC